MAVGLDRYKGHRWIWGPTYRLLAGTKFLLGARSTLRLLLTSAWVLERLAKELAAREAPEHFRYGLTPELLGGLVPARSTVLDVGCGRGGWVGPLLNLDCEVTAVDVDEESLSVVREMYAGQCEILSLDITKETAGLGPFDFALLIHVLEHIEDAKALLTQLQGIAREVIIEVPDFESDPLNAVRLSLNTPFYSDADHVHEFTERELSDLVLEAGWQLTYFMKSHGTQVLVASASEFGKR